jgi:hypothetical protein
MIRREQKQVLQSYSDDMLHSISTIQGLLTIAQYYQNRTEMNSYLALISTCVMRVEEIIRKAKADITDTCNH